jgi:GT2 family glycosyltransferase
MSSHLFNLPKVAAAIVTYNHKKPVLKLISLLAQQNIPTFVTENNGADGTVEAIKNNFPQVSLLASTTNLGGCGGFNCAALAALSTGCEYLIYIDDDALPEDDCIEQLVNFLDANPDYIFAAPSIYITSKPDTLQEAGGGVDFSRSNPVEAWYRFHINPELPPVLDIDYASACCLMVRADALREIGVFDWAFFIFSDDVDLCLRLRHTFDKKGACVTTAKALHDFPWAKPFAPMRLYFFQRNGLRLICNHRQKGQYKSLFSALFRLHRRIFYSAFSGDKEINQTLICAFKDAWNKKFGNWNSWIIFASDRPKIDQNYFIKHNINRILIDISIEDFEPAILASIKAKNPKASIDILCDENRVVHHQRKANYNQVFSRKLGFIGSLSVLPALLQEKYDMVITDASMEVRRPSSMCGKHAAFFHNNCLYQADNSPYAAIFAGLISYPVGLVAALLTINHFRKPFPASSPPSEAADLLTEIGIDPEIGQPYGRLSQ